MGIFGYCFLIASNFPFKAKDQRHLASTRKTNEVRLRFLYPTWRGAGRAYPSQWI